MAPGRAALLPAALLLLSCALVSPAAASRGLSQASDNTTAVDTSVPDGWFLGRASWWVATPRPPCMRVL
jgi:hypothetical protein